MTFFGVRCSARDRGRVCSLRPRARGRDGDDRHRRHRRRRPSGRSSSASRRASYAAEDIKVDIVFVQSSARARAAARRGLARHHHVDRPRRSDPRHRQGRADRDRAARSAVAALRADREAGHQEHQGAQGQDHLARRPEGHHQDLRRAHAGAERRQAGRVRHGVRRRDLGARLGAASRARSTPRSCCRRSTSMPTAAGFNDARPDRRLRAGAAVLRRGGEPQLGAPRTAPRCDKLLAVHNKSVAWFLDRKNRDEADRDDGGGEQAASTDDVEKAYDFFCKQQVLRADRQGLARRR